MKIENGCVQRLSKVSESGVQNGVGVVPSVSDGALNLPSQREGATTEHSAHGCLPRLRDAEWLLKLKGVMLNGTPITRSRVSKMSVV